MKSACRKHKLEMSQYGGGYVSTPENDFSEDHAYREYKCPKGCGLHEDIKKSWRDTTECVHCGK